MLANEPDLREPIRWESATRYYVAWLHCDLLGDWVLSRWWGGLGNRRGGHSDVAVRSLDDGMRALHHLEKRRQKTRLPARNTTRRSDMPKVLNKYHGQPPAGAVYIGRPGKWGNLFQIGPDGTRDEVVAKYREWILAKPDLIAAARRELAGKDLVCFCAPKPCHGDVLLEIANAG